MTDITFIIHVWLDVENFLGVSKKDFMRKIRTPHWIKRRIRIFNTFTLPSLLNQDFDDFQIFLFCGRKNKQLHKDIKKDDRLHLIYDYGKSKYLDEIETPYVNVTRIDSDDMFREDLMIEVAGLSLIHI